MTKHRLLLVEDDEFIGPLVKELLCVAGYDVVLTRDLSDTMLLENFAFSAVIADYRLKYSDGCQVINFLRSKIPDIPALLMSGYGQRVSDCCDARGIQDVGFLAKPFTIAELSEKIESALS